MKNSEKITKQITQIEKEISELEERNQEIDEDIFSIKKDHKVLVSDKGQAEIQSLTSSREIIKEVLEEKAERLEALKLELEEAEKEEVRQGYFDECVNLAKEAESTKNEYLKLVKEVDEEFYQKLLQIADLKAKWKQANDAFIEFAISLEPTFDYRKEDSPEKEAARKEFIKAVDEKAGVLSEHARTEVHLSFRHFREVSIDTNQYAIETKVPIKELAERAAVKRAKEKKRELRAVS